MPIGTTDHMKKLLPFIALIVVLGALTPFIKVPYNIRTKGIVMPAKEWGLYKAFDGTLVNMLEDHVNGIINEYKVHEFQRGDIVQFLFNQDLLGSELVNEGDTIAWVVSNDLKLNILEKKGALAYEKSLLDVYLSGDKPEAVQLALDQIELARQEVKNQEKITERIVQLYEQDVVSRQDYELAVNDLLVKEYRLEIAQSAYQAVLAGEKEEEIGAVRARIAAIEYQLSHLKEHLADMNILSPITGQLMRQRIANNDNSGQVIKIADLSTYVVSVPIDLFEKKYLHIGQAVSLSTPHSRKEHTGAIIGIDNSVQIINRQPKIFVSVLVNPVSNEYLLYPNMIVDARIHHENISLIEYLIRKSRIVYQN